MRFSVMGGECDHSKHLMDILQDVRQLRTVKKPRRSCRLCLACRCVLRAKSGSLMPCMHSADDGAWRWTGVPSAMRVISGAWASADQHLEDVYNWKASRHRIFQSHMVTEMGSTEKLRRIRWDRESTDVIS